MRLGLLLAALFTSSLWGTTTDGTMWGGTVERTGDYATTGITATPTVLWMRRLGAPIATTTAPSATMVYVATTDGTFYALDRTTGDTVWTKQLIPPTYGSPAVNEISNRVFISDGEGMKAFTASTGADLYTVPASGPVFSSAGEDDSVVYVGTSSGLIKAVDGATGAPVWENNVGVAVTASACISPAASRVYSADHAGNVIALDMVTGNVDWKTNTANVGIIRVAAPIDPTPAFDPTGLIAVSGIGEVMRLDATTGALMWVVPSESSYGPSPSIAHGNVYACVALKSISALDPVDGSELWRFATDGNLAARSVASSGGATDAVYVSDVLGKVYGLDPVDGSELWRFEANGGFFSDVSVSDGEIFAGTLGGVLYSLTGP